METFTLLKQYGREELILLLRLMRAYTLPGLGDDPLEGFSKEEAVAALLASGESLRARGIIEISEADKRVRIDQVTFALIGSCLRPRASFLVSSIGADGHGIIRYYHVSPHLSVEHSFPDVGVDAFLAASNLTVMLPRILELMALGGSESEVEPFEVEESILDQAKSFARTGAQEMAMDCLKRSNAAEKTITAFVRTLIEPIHNSSIIKIKHFQAHADSSVMEQVDGFATLQGSSGLWVLTPKAGADNRVVKVEPINVNGAAKRVEGLVTSLGTPNDQNLVTKGGEHLHST